MTATDASKIKSTRVVYLVFATLTLLVLGLIYAWSIFAKPIGAEFTDYAPILSQVFQVSMFAFCVSAIFGAALIKKTSAKLTIIVAAVLLGGGFILTALTAGLGSWSLFVFYGIFAGSGCGIAYNAIISLVNPWWPDRIGVASGVMMMGFGISALVFGSLANSVFDSGVPWQSVFFVIAAVGIIVMVALAVVVKPAPAGLGQALGLSGAASVTEATPTQKQNILTTKVFWLYSAWATLSLCGGLTIIGTAAQASAALGLTFGALLVGLISVMNGVARIVNGAIFDKFGLVAVMMVGAVACTASMVLCALGFTLGQPAADGATSPMAFIYVIGAILVAFSYGGVPVMASAYTKQRYDSKIFAKNLGIANLNIASAAIINMVIAAVLGTVYGANATVIFILLAVFAALALVATFIFSSAYKGDLKKIDAELN